MHHHHSSANEHQLIKIQLPHSFPSVSFQTKLGLLELTYANEEQVHADALEPKSECPCRAARRNCSAQSEQAPTFETIGPGRSAGLELKEVQLFPPSFLPSFWGQAYPRT